jgi:hypothetical protein
MQISMLQSSNNIILSGISKQNETFFFSSNITVMFCHLKNIVMSTVNKRFKLKCGWYEWFDFRENCIKHAGSNSHQILLGYFP